MALVTPQRTTYWAVQVLGWSSYMVLLALPTFLREGQWMNLALITAAMAAIGITTSHALRICFLEWKWLDLVPGKLLVRMVLGALAFGVLAGLLQATLHDVVFTTAEPLIRGGAQRLVEVLLGWVLQLFVWAVVYVAFHYIVRSRAEEMRALRSEAANRESQLANLRSQLNPHFMFNALNGIRALIPENPEKARDAITLLSVILRNAMASVKRMTVPLGEEVDVVRAYLQLEAIRYEERLKTSFHIDPAVQRSPIPPMLLQTLVENAVRHGIAKTPEGGRVRIEAVPAEGGVHIRVSNTGAFRRDPGRPSGIGIRNTLQRLEQLYDGKATLRMANENGMVVCDLYIPALVDHKLNEASTWEKEN